MNCCRSRAFRSRAMTIAPGLLQWMTSPSESTKRITSGGEDSSAFSARESTRWSRTKRRNRSNGEPRRSRLRLRLRLLLRLRLRLRSPPPPMLGRPPLPGYRRIREMTTAFGFRTPTRSPSARMYRTRPVSFVFRNSSTASPRVRSFFRNHCSSRS